MPDENARACSSIAKRDSLCGVPPIALHIFLEGGKCKSKQDIGILRRVLESAKAQYSSKMHQIDEEALL